MLAGVVRLYSSLPLNFVSTSIAEFMFVSIALHFSRATAPYVIVLPDCPDCPDGACSDASSKLKEFIVLN